MRAIGPLLLLAAWCGLAEGSSTDPDAFAQATELYSQGKHSAAYGRLMRLADAGHAEAAQLVLNMHRFGPRLYGTLWDATPEQLAHWKALQLSARDAHSTH